MIRRFSRIDPGWVAAALLPLIGILPTLTPGVIDTADGPLHVQRIHAMGIMLSEGVLYPRWIPYFHLGFGYPIFNFYPPGVFYLGGLLAQIGIAATTAFTIISALGWILGSMGVYGLARRFIPPHAAILAAFLWAYAPSRLFEVWDQGSLPQIMAAAMIPWVISGVIGVAYQPTRRGILSIALPLAGMIFSHQPITFITALYVAPMSLLVPLWASRTDWRTFPKRFGFIISGVVLGAGLAAIFLIPLVTELRFVQAARGAEDNVAYLISNFLHPGEIFMQPPAADLTDLRFELPTTFGIVTGILAVPGLIALALRKQYGLLIGLLIALGFTLFMLVEQSLDVWLAIPFFRQLRFPERFLRLGVALLAIPGGASILLLPKRYQMAGLTVALIAMLVSALTMIYPNKESVDWDKLSARDEIDFELTHATWGTTSYDEFDPIWGRNIPLPGGGPPEDDEYVEHPLRLVVNRVDMARYGDVMQVNEPDESTIQVTLTQNHAVRLHQYYFPGWTGQVDGEPTEIYPDEEFGLITLDLPPGEHEITLHYAGTTMQRVGTIITLLCIGVAAVLAITGRAAAPADEREQLTLRPALAISGGVIAFALVNTLVITPQTLWFRYQSPVAEPVYMQTPVYASFGSTFELLGYTLKNQEIAPDEFLDVMLFWRAERELDVQYRPVAQLVNLTVSEAWAVSEPFFPGGGQTVGYPQDRFASEVHELRVFENTPPHVGRVLVQMVDAATGEPLLLPDGSDRLLLEPLIRIRGEGVPVENRLDLRFDDTVELRCADVQADESEITIKLYWHVLATPAQDMATFVHGLDADGNIIEQADRQPLGGNYPPSLWRAGQNLVDHYTLPATDDLAQIAIGLYRPDDAARLAITQDGEPVADDRVLLELNGESCQP